MNTNYDIEEIDIKEFNDITENLDEEISSYNNTFNC